MLLLTKKASFIVTDGTPDFYVKTEDYMLLSKDDSLRTSILDQLGVDSITVEWIGEELEKDKIFERKEPKLKLPDIQSRKDMGYHHRL